MMQDPAQDSSPADLPYREESASGHSTSDDEKTDLLQRVLEESIEQLSDDHSTIPIHLEPLIAVARQYKGLPLAIDPIVVELIEAALSDSLRWGQQQPKQWRSISSQIAKTLMADTRSSERMGRLWDRLQFALAQSDVGGS